VLVFFFEEAQEFDASYYLSYSGKERVEAMQILRETYFKHIGFELDEKEKDYEEFLALLNKHRVNGRPGITPF